jgi:hypothetical protein
MSGAQVMCVVKVAERKIDSVSETKSVLVQNYLGKKHKSMIGVSQRPSGWVIDDKKDRQDGRVTSLVGVGDGGER